MRRVRADADAHQEQVGPHLSRVLECSTARCLIDSSQHQTCSGENIGVFFLRDRARCFSIGFYLT